MIKIANLMENSYVTVTDRDGHVVTQLGPVMGSALWDGSGADGERVPTGIYNIYAAQGSQPVVTGAPQATVMIIR
jgi:flagellar hook assembly protein FlgD